MISITDLTKIYRNGTLEVRALDGVSLEVAPGEMVAIMGPSGSGKSTFMNIVGCLDQPTSGSYQLGGREVASLRPRELASVRNQELGFVFQSFNLLPKLTAVQNVELPLVYAGVPAARRAQLSQAALVQVGLGERLRHRPKELSGGQQQRVAIARAVVGGPRLILADEPTGNLDSHASVEIMALFQRLHQGGITVVLVTHEPEIAEFTQRVVRFRDGRVVADEAVHQRRAEWEAAS